MAPKIKVAIIESSGHVYAELISLLEAHPRVELVYLKIIPGVVKKPIETKIDLADENGLAISKKNNNQIDLLFITGDRDFGTVFLKQYKLPQKLKLICLTGEFRQEDNATIEGRKFVYGLPELKKESIKSAHNIAVPGGMATCIALGLLPVAHKKLLRDVYTTGISGSTEDETDEGEKEGKKSHKVKSAHIAADSTLGEINRPLATLSKNDSAWSIHFVPWKGEFSRGIFVTSQLKCTESLSEMYFIFEKFYADRKFINLSREPVFLKKVLNTNNCFINLEKAGDILVIHSAIDNLMKGAAGQAIQNMNLMFGFDETLGLMSKSKKRIIK